MIGEVQAKEYAHGRRLLGSLGHLQPEARQVSPAVEKFGASEKSRVPCYNSWPTNGPPPSRKT